jgi:hypothetical protein
MANDRDSNNDRASGQNSGSGNKRDRVIGEGMNSLDSTQAPLKAETGEPDWEAMTGGKRGQSGQSGQSSQRNDSDEDAS